MSCGISNVKPGAGREKDLREAAFETLWLGADVVFPGHYIEGGSDLEEWKMYMKAIILIRIPVLNEAFVPVFIRIESNTFCGIPS